MLRPMVNLVELVHIVDVLDKISAPDVATKALRRADLSRDVLRSAPGWVPYAPVAVTLEAAARILGDRHLGVRIGRHFDYNAYEGYADFVLSGPTLGAALIRARRALPLIHPGSELILGVEGRRVRLGFSANVETIVGYRHIAEGALFVIIQVFRSFLGPSWCPLWLEIDIEDSKARSLLEEFMQSELRLGAKQTALVFDKSDLRAPNPNPHHGKTATTFQSVAAQMAAPIPKTTADSLLHLFRMQKADGDLTQDRAAFLLSTGTRTLQRELQTEGTSFRTIRELHLKSRAVALLTDTRRSIDDVARDLGYTEPNSFRRAFKSWTGSSPSHYRRPKHAF